MKKVVLTWDAIYRMTVELGVKILQEYDAHNVNMAIYGVPRGGIHVAQELQSCYPEKFHLVENPADANVFIDDIIDSGATKKRYEKNYPGVPFFALFNKNEFDSWIVFPWEIGEEAGPEENIRRLLEYIGEDPNREGLVETPRRILKAYDRLFGGYRQKAEDLMKVFIDGACNEMVILKNIRFYSTCEHHMLPFFGVAHVAYIPNGKVVGVSKLARLVDMYARRMQIQERIGTQVVDTLMKLLDAKGAACVIRAQHMCMTSRGVENQTAEMVTSALRGAFLENVQTRMEFMQMIKGE